jgi:type IV secretory pathway VirB10-like protein
VHGAAPRSSAWRTSRLRGGAPCSAPCGAARSRVLRLRGGITAAAKEIHKAARVPPLPPPLPVTLPARRGAARRAAAPLSRATTPRLPPGRAAAPTRRRAHAARRAQAGDAARVRALLAEGHAADVPDAEGQSALHVAAIGASRPTA